MIVMAVVTASVGAVIGGFIASEIGIRRTEKRLRRLINRLLPDLKRAIQEILSDETVRERAKLFVDDILEDVKRRGPEIVRAVMRSAQAEALKKATDPPRLPEELSLEEKGDNAG